MPSREWEPAAEQLKSYLASVGHTASFEPGPDPQRPPDAVFQVNGETWAVEHTRLFEYVQGSDGELERSAWDASALKLQYEVNAETQGYRQTGWILSILGPYSKKVLVKTARAAIEAIKKDDPEIFRDRVYGRARKIGLEPPEEVTLKRCGNDTLVTVISGLSSDSFVPGTTRRSSHIQSRVDHAIKRILKAKVPKLKNLDYPEKGLVIENQDILVDADFVAESIAKRQELASQIDFIFLVSQGLVTPVWPKVNE